jgi:hypothetical protein
MSCNPQIVRHADDVVTTPDKATGNEARYKKDSIIQLNLRASHVEFVEEPVDIKKGGTKLIQNEAQAIVLHERVLQACCVSLNTNIHSYPLARSMEIMEGLTNAITIITSALVAWANVSGPKRW